MSDAVAGFNSLLQIGDGATPTENFTTIAEVKDISGPSLSLNPVGVTNQSSTGGWAEFIGGLLDAGEVTFDINYLPTHATHNAATGLIRDLVNRTKRNFKLIFPNAGATTWAFTALVTAFSPSEPVADALTASVSLKISGQPTLV